MNERNLYICDGKKCILCPNISTNIFTHRCMIYQIYIYIYTYLSILSKTQTPGSLFSPFANSVGYVYTMRLHCDVVRHLQGSTVTYPAFREAVVHFTGSLTFFEATEWTCLSQGIWWQCQSVDTRYIWQTCNTYIALTWISLK